MKTPYTSRLIYLFKSKFVRNIFLVASGTAGAQVINIAIMPLLTRIYDPHIFGILGTFTAICTSVMPFIALTFPVAIVIATSESEAKKICTLSVFIGISFSLLTFLLLVFFDELIIYQFKLDEVGYLIYFLPLVMLFATLNQIGRQWSIRKGKYSVIVKATVLQSLLVNSSRLAMGLLFPSAIILIGTYVLGSLVSSIILIYDGAKLIFNEVLNYSLSDLKKQLSKYKDFPLYRAPQVALHSLSESMPVLFLSTLFNNEVVGLYILARLTLGVPVGLIGQSITDVFFPKFVETSDVADKKSLLRKVYIGILLFTIIPFIVLGFSAPFIYSFVFGEDWSNSGYFAQYMSVWLFFVLLSRPAVSVIPALKLQRFFLGFELITLLVKSSTMYFSNILFNDPQITIMYLSLVNAFCYLFLMIYVYRRSGL